MDAPVDRSGGGAGLRLLGRLVAGLTAGAIGFFAGVWILLSTTGLDHPGWAPVAMLAGASLAGSATVAVLADLPASRAIAVTVSATIGGTALGLWLRAVDDNYEWTIASGVLLIAAVVAAARGLEP